MLSMNRTSDIESEFPQSNNRGAVHTSTRRPS